MSYVRLPLVQRTAPRKLPRGWLVYLTGHNFDLVTAAQFGALPAVSPYVQTDRELVFVLPGTAPAGSYAVSLQGPFGTTPAGSVQAVELEDLDVHAPPSATPQDYTSQLQELLPKGPAWTRRPGTFLWKLLSSAAEELARVHARALSLVSELTPSQTVDSLAAWEKELGLPEPGMTLASSDAGRRADIFRKATSLGGCSATYFEQLVAVLGYEAQVEELYSLSAPFKAGSAVAGDALTQGPWLFTWRAVLADETTPARVLATLQRVKPSHTLVGARSTFDMVGDDLDEMVGDDGTTMMGST